MDIVCTGKGVVVPVGARVHQVLREGYTLYVGKVCHDGRPITESLRYQEAVQRGIPIVFCEDALADSMECLSVASNELWVDRYAPKTVKDLIGHGTVAAQVAQWLSLTVRPPSEKGLLLTGPPGIGKSTLIRIVAKQLGYHVAESNASDARTASVLRGQIALGMRRLRKEVIVMEEADGCDRGGAAELAVLIQRSPTPIICVANDARAVASLAKVCLHVKVARPTKTVIATAMETIAKKERVSVTRAELETMVEASGNDIRAVLNALQMRGSGKAVSAEKDATLRMDLFSATQKLMSQKRLSWTDAEDVVFVDHHMVPLMVQEAYLSASRSLEEAVAASDRISEGDLIQRRLFTTQDWTLLPSVVAGTVSVARGVSGPAPFQIFPRVLGKMSSKRAHEARLQVVGRARKISGSSFRLEEADSMYSILARPLLMEPPRLADTVERLDAIGLTRDDLLESIEGVVTPLGISTKTRSAFTRLYHKKNPVDRGMKRKAMEAMDVDGESDKEEEEEEEEM
jgi:DNA polymerase III delta prime subunit